MMLIQMKKNIFLNSLFIFLILSFSSCLVPRRYFEDDKVTSPPDYSKEKYWAALPTKKDSADAVPHGSGLKDGQANAKADVFFIYPTIYLAGRDWNADINNKRLNRRIDKTTIRLQASVFNGSCKVYAPRYRQAVLASFRNDNENGKKALDFAYQDVKAAFEYYLKYYNNGEPLISHPTARVHGKPRGCFTNILKRILC